MPERAQITGLGPRSVFRLKSLVPEHLDGVKSASLAGRELPKRVGDTASGETRALCLAPGEWLLVSHAPPAAEIPAAGFALVDLSDAFAALGMTGSAVREVLSKGCGLDLHPRSFPPGRCARTRFAMIPVVIDCLDSSSFELYVARSYGSYLHAWLSDAAVEFKDT